MRITSFGSCLIVLGYNGQTNSIVGKKLKQLKSTMIVNCIIEIITFESILSLKKRQLPLRLVCHPEDTYVECYFLHSITFRTCNLLKGNPGKNWKVNLVKWVAFHLASTMPSFIFHNRDEAIINARVSYVKLLEIFFSFHKKMLKLLIISKKISKFKSANYAIWKKAPPYQPIMITGNRK